MGECEPRNFLQPCLLLLLRERSDHGDDLVNRRRADRAAGLLSVAVFGAGAWVVPGAGDVALKNITLGPVSGEITLTWDSQPGPLFDITHSATLADGFPGVTAAGIPAEAGSTTSHTFANPIPAAPRLFFRVERP